MSYITENNAERPATKKQLWALYCLTKQDYRGQDLTMLDASILIERCNKQGSVKKSKQVKNEVSALEKDFIEYMSGKIEDMIATARNAIKIKSVVEDDEKFFPNKKDRKQYAFFGYGCGITIIKYDKRSKIGKEIESLSSKHHLSTFLNLFLKGFSAKEIKYFENVGCPLSALFCQDYQISRSYESAVASYMIKRGVKNVHIQTFDD